MIDHRSAENAEGNGSPEAAGTSSGKFMQRSKKLMRDGVWQFVGAIAGIIAILVTLAMANEDDKAGQQRPGISGEVTGDCSAVGVGNNVTCSR